MPKYKNTSKGVLKFRTYDKNRKEIRVSMRPGEVKEFEVKCEFPYLEELIEKKLKGDK